MPLTIEPLTPAAFAPFGLVIEQPQRAQDAAGPGWTWWGENVKLAGGDCLVYVGPPEHPDEPTRLPPLESFRVFRLQAGQGVLINQAVWHGAPLALDKPLNVVVALLHNTGRQDGHVVRFEDQPVLIERAKGG